MIHLTVTGGLSQRIVALICAIRYARLIQHPITLYWSQPTRRQGIPYEANQAHPNDNFKFFFQSIPDLTSKVWSPDCLSHLSDFLTLRKPQVILNNYNLHPEFHPKNTLGNPIYPKDWTRLWDQLLIIPKNYAPPNTQTIVQINPDIDLILQMISHPFGLSDDTPHLKPIHRYWGLIRHPRKKNPFELQLSQIAHKLIPLPAIAHIIELQQKRLFAQPRPIIGFHFRRTDFRPTKTISYLTKIFEEHYFFNPQFQDHQFFLCSDDSQLELHFKNRFSKHLRHPVLTYEDPLKYHNNINGSQRSLIDLYLLSKSNHIVGTRGSAFNYLAFLLSGPDTTLEYHS